MNNFESYFEIVAQYLGIALFFTGLLPIVVTLALKVYEMGKDLYLSFANVTIKHSADVKPAEYTVEASISDTKAKTQKLGWHFGRFHAEA
ncbi:MAG: hypothetical protein ABI113_14955 [Mucilaginibacter sp.]